MYTQEEAKATAERQLEGCLQMTQRHQQTLKVRQESDALLTAGTPLDTIISQFKAVCHAKLSVVLNSLLTFSLITTSEDDVHDHGQAQCGSRM